MASQAKKFSLVKAVAGNKRDSEQNQQTNAKKIPKVSEMTPVEARTPRVTNDAPVVVCVYPVRRMDILVALESKLVFPYQQHVMPLIFENNGQHK